MGNKQEDRELRRARKACEKASRDGEGGKCRVHTASGVLQRRNGSHTALPSLDSSPDARVSSASGSPNPKKGALKRGSDADFWDAVQGNQAERFREAHTLPHKKKEKKVEVVEELDGLSPSNRKKERREEEEFNEKRKKGKRHPACEELRKTTVMSPEHRSACDDLEAMM